MLKADNIACADFDLSSLPDDDFRERRMGV